MARAVRLGPASPLRSVRRGRSRDVEHHEQALLVQWATLASGRVPALRLLYAIPNFAGFHGSTKARLRSGARAKAEGRRAGFPDLCLPVARGDWHALYVELKAPDGHTTPAQQAWIRALREAGNAAVVAVGWEAARAQIERYLALPPSPLSHTLED
jgi:hypothetical protein